MGRAVFDAADAWLRRHQPRLLLLWAIASPLAFVLAWSASPAAWSLGVAAVAVALGFGWAVQPRRTAQPIEASAAGLRLGRELLLRRHDIVAGELLEDDEPVVVLHPAGGLPLGVRVRTIAIGQALLGALSLHVGPRAMSLELVRTSRAPIGAGIATFLVPMGFAHLWSGPHSHLHGEGWGVRMAVLAALFLCGMLLTFYFHKRSARRLRIGADGVLLEEAGARRLLRYEDIASVDSFARSLRDYGPRDGRFTGVELELRSGERLRIVIDQPYALGTGPGARTEAIVTLLRRGIARAVTHPQPMTDELARGQSAAKDWLRRLQRLIAHNDYRHGHLAPERLAPIVADPALEPSVRLGAAALLSTMPSPEQRDRLRIVADGVVEPNLRDAIDELAEAELDEQRIHALGRLAAE